jgi:hypothetical protein
MAKAKAKAARGPVAARSRTVQRAAVTTRAHQQQPRRVGRVRARKSKKDGRRRRRRQRDANQQLSNQRPEGGVLWAFFWIPLAPCRGIRNAPQRGFPQSQINPELEAGAWLGGGGTNELLWPAVAGM